MGCDFFTYVLLILTKLVPRQSDLFLTDTLLLTMAFVSGFPSWGAAVDVEVHNRVTFFFRFLFLLGTLRVVLLLHVICMTMRGCHVLLAGCDTVSGCGGIGVWKGV